ncbi:MAG: hypothetical protein N2C12_18760 [Planctomycetales bacterium]
MTTVTTSAGLCRASAMLAALLLALGCRDANASVTVTKTNTTGATVNGGSVNQTVNFSAADFAGVSTIANTTVQIAFSKLGLFGFLWPNFNEVGFTLTSANGTSIALIRNQNSSASSFNDPFIGTFNGTVTFDQSAAQAVNANPNQIQAGTFQPDGGNLDTLIGGDAIGSWTLNISDSNGGFPSNPLTVTSWSVSVTSVPEPNSIALWSMTGILAAMIVFHRPRRQKNGVRSGAGIQAC